MSWREIPQLLWVGIENLLWQAQLRRREGRTLGTLSWYRRLRRELRHDAWRWDLPAARRAPALAGLPPDDLLYGETPIVTAWEIFRDVELKAGERVVDLGCGTGVALLVAALAYQAQGIGVEVVPHRLQRAVDLQRALGVRGVEFLQDDFRTMEWPQADVYLLSPTALSEATWKLLQQRMAQTPPGTRAVSLTVALPEPQWRTRHHLKRAFSWGETEVFVQVRASS